MKEDLSKGLCVDGDTERWVHEHTASRPASNCDFCRVARDVCRGCPVRAACLREGLGLAPGMQFGVWGGWSAAERVKFNKKQREEAKNAKA